MFAIRVFLLCNNFKEFIIKEKSADLYLMLKYLILLFVPNREHLRMYYGSFALGNNRVFSIFDLNLVEFI